MAKRQTIQVAGQDVSLSNLDKLLYPAAGFTKAQVIEYYIRIAPVLLPHLKDRPITLKRYPNGVDGQHFYEKNAPSFTPDWVKTFMVPRRLGGTDIRYILINDLPTLVWCSNLANLELHPFLHRVPDIGRPTSVVFDLDPGEGTDVLTCARIAFSLKDALERLGLQSFVKVSGSKGIQVYVPLNSAVTYSQTGEFARALAQVMEEQHKGLVVSEMAKKLRKARSSSIGVRTRTSRRR